MNYAFHPKIATKKEYTRGGVISARRRQNEA